MSDTPRTDALCSDPYKADTTQGLLNMAVELSRDLERENAALRAEVEAWKAFALHQMHCAVCAESIADCDVGMPLYHAARKESA
jgi:hypothetical protein